MPIRLQDIVTDDFQTDIQDSFAHATGFGVVFTDMEGRHIGKGGNFCRFCHAINETEAGKRACALSNKGAIQLALQTKKPSIYICHAGLVNIEIPLFVGGEAVGAITAGQVLCDKEDAYPKDAVDSRTDWLSNPLYAEYYREIEVFTQQKIESTTRALYNISNYIMQVAAYSESQKELLLYEKRQIELEHQLKTAELDALQKQVAPHFIFNVINSVSRMISMREYDTAEKMLTAFSQMLRYSLSSMRSHVTLRQELGYIQNYLAIQQLRFGARIRCQVLCDEGMEDMEVPFFALQPLVENSVEHGLLGLENGGTICLTCRRLSGCDEIVVEDDGAGISPGRLAEIRAALRDDTHPALSGHVGLRNSHSRLRHLYGGRLSFTVESGPKTGTRVCIRVSHSTA